MNNFIEILGVVMFLIGIFFYLLKVYFHFKYIKIVRGYSKSLNFFKYLFSIEIGVRNFVDLFEIVIPFLIFRNKGQYTHEDTVKLKKLEKRVYFSILIFAIGIVTLAIVVKLKRGSAPDGGFV
jgi:hypothetical protein